MADGTRNGSSDGRGLPLRHRPLSGLRVHRRRSRTGRRRRSVYVRHVLLAAGTAALLIGVTYVIVSLLLSRQVL